MEGIIIIIPTRWAFATEKHGKPGLIRELTRIRERKEKTMKKLALLMALCLLVSSIVPAVAEDVNPVAEEALNTVHKRSRGRIVERMLSSGPRQGE